jgi:hypothetical protein
LHDFVEMALASEYVPRPVSQEAEHFADQLQEMMVRFGLLESCNIFTPDGHKVLLNYFPPGGKEKVAFKLQLSFMAALLGSWIEGQVKLNINAVQKRNWDLIDLLAESGFRSGLERKLDNFKIVAGKDNQGNELTTKVKFIKLKTAPVTATRAIEKIKQLVLLLADFEGVELIELNPVVQDAPAPIAQAPTTETKLSATAPAWVPQEPPLPTAADWVPLPSRATATATNTTTTCWVDDVVDDDDAQMTRLREQIAKLEQKKAQKNAEAERQKKLDAFKAQQAAALAEFEKSLL